MLPQRYPICAWNGILHEATTQSCLSLHEAGEAVKDYKCETNLGLRQNTFQNCGSQIQKYGNKKTSAGHRQNRGS